MTVDLCPMGCGRTTDDVAGGPCRACWDDAYSIHDKQMSTAIYEDEEADA